MNGGLGLDVRGFSLMVDTVQSPDPNSFTSASAWDSERSRTSLFFNSPVSESKSPLAAIFTLSIRTRAALNETASPFLFKAAFRSK